MMPAEFPVARGPAPAYAEKIASCRTRPETRSHISAGIAFRLCPKIIAVGNACVRRKRIYRRRNQRATILVRHKYCIDRRQRFFKLAELLVQRLLPLLYLFVGQIAKDGIDAGKGQIDRLEYLGRLFGENIKRGRQLLVGVRKGALVIEPARIGKKRQWNDERCGQHCFEKA